MSLILSPTHEALYPPTKFQPPPLRAEHVQRERCLRLVRTPPLAAAHLLISAPAGAGKSTLAAQWAAERGRCAWVSLSEADDEPGQFWAAFILGIREVCPGFGGELLSEVLGGAELRGLFPHLIDELAELAEVGVVLDDLHLIGNRECHYELGWLLERAPPNVRLALCTREDPPLRVGRLVAHGQLAVLRVTDLQFDAGETAEFLHDRLGLDLDPAQIGEISERTDGWAAGVYLAALSLRAGVPAAEVIASLTRGDRLVRGYVRGEVLDMLEPRHRAFLEGIAILPRFCAPLCDAVLEREDSHELIAELVSSNLFVIPLDLTATWYRLHHFFAAMLREALTDPATIATRHERAAQWHRDHGHVPEAIEHLVKAGRYEEAGHLIAATQVTYLNRSRLGAAVGRWLDLLPARVVESSAPLCISRAWVAALAGLDGEMERWLQRAASLPSPEPLPDGSASAAGQVALIRGLNCGQDLGRGLAQVRRAAELERQGSPWWPLVQLMLGLWGYLEHGAGEDVLEALRAADATAFSTGQAQSAAIAPALIAVVLLECGDRDGAEAMARRAGRMRDLLGIRRVAQTAYSWWGTSVVHLGCGRLEEAAQDALMGVTLTADIAPGLDTLFFRPPSRIQLARVRLAQGDRPAARTLLREVRDQLARAPDAGLMMRWLEETETAAGIRARTGDGADELSERELTVLRMLSGSANLGEIASQLFVSRNTVKSHTKAIYAKLGVTSRHDAVSRARELRLT